MHIVASVLTASIPTGISRAVRELVCKQNLMPNMYFLFEDSTIIINIYSVLHL